MSGDSTTLLQITARYRRTNYGRKKKRPRISPGPILHKAKGLRLCFVFLLDDFFSGFLIDHLHAKAHLAAIVKSQKFDLNLLAFLQNSFGWFRRLFAICDT